MAESESLQRVGGPAPVQEGRSADIPVRSNVRIRTYRENNAGLAMNGRCCGQECRQECPRSSLLKRALVGTARPQAFRGPFCGDEPSPPLRPAEYRGPGLLGRWLLPGWVAVRGGKTLFVLALELEKQILAGTDCLVPSLWWP